MSDEPIDLNEVRNARAQPDPQFIRKDDYGRPMFTYTCSYVMGGKSWALDIWAYDDEDAEARVAGIRESLKCDGKVFAIIPV
jgi:hypothetical protein